ncbi:uncharacterized protein LOC109609646 [Aethina tumida]|uniref:uncharacterized protein LOC109609646 n=1 Tax=Aethina tumida TaxID=116153 RepID=UPI00096B4CA4|nr:uncharacterized protein LOC109609646 [Aethina tumida]
MICDVLFSKRKAATKEHSILSFLYSAVNYAVVLLGVLVTNPVFFVPFLMLYLGMKLIGSGPYCIDTWFGNVEINLAKCLSGMFVLFNWFIVLSLMSSKFNCGVCLAICNADTRCFV